MPRPVTPQTTLDNLKKEAKRWLKALRDNVDEARARLLRAFPTAPSVPKLRDVQHAIAREFGLPGWTGLKDLVVRPGPLRRYEQVAEALVVAYETGDLNAMQIVWDYFGHMRSWDAMRRYTLLDLGRPEQAERPEDAVVTVEDARDLVARHQGFSTWRDLVEMSATIPLKRPSLADKPAGLYSIIDEPSRRTEIARSRDWDELLALASARRAPGLHAMGQMTDDLLKRVSELDHLVALDLGNSKALTDAGLKHLARMQGLRHLNLSVCPVTDSGIDVLRHLPALETVGLSSTGITDAGARHLASCQNLLTVNLSGTATGDGAIRALGGKEKLHEFRSGNAVTDQGLALFHEFPVFKEWKGGEAGMWLTGADGGCPNLLHLRGRFTSGGFASLVGLDGLFGLNIDDPHLGIGAAHLAPLARLGMLSWLSVDATDESMPAIGALPHLRYLMCQDTTAGDDGFVALSRSRTIETIWGRRCHALRRRGFTALAEMPALRNLSVSCRNVDDAGLSALPRFPALRELMPMDVPDAAYKYVGQCAGLESLVLMYCRDTGDAATEQITGLANLKKYFASYNRITDRTPELLSGMAALEEVTFDSCAGLTDAGVKALARLPRLRKLSVSGMRGVASEVVAAFGEQVKVRYSL